MKKTQQEKDELYKKYKKLINKVLKDMKCNRRTKEEYEDYYSIAELGLVKAINDVKGDWKSVKSSYFYACIRNEIIRYYRYKTMNKRELIDTNMANIYDYQVSSNIDLERDYINKETYKILYDSINNLKPEYKELIIKRFGLGVKKMTCKEIAKETNISPQAVHQKEKYILKKIKKELIKKK